MCRAIDSALAQTFPVDEIIVVDDGSTDGTGEMLRDRYGQRIRYAWQPNAGVSSARNRGMSMAHGRYIALLDSDDQWLPEKTARQHAWLEEHPEYGMVVCDIEMVDADLQVIGIYRRREVIREDGWALRWALANPALAPASTLVRREVYEDIGGFDESLRTAEDIDYHLRIARRWQIGVVEETLVRTMRGHEGLSAQARTYDDYLLVFERAVEAARGLVSEPERREALAMAYIRNARGLMLGSRWREAARLLAKAWRCGDGNVRKQVLAQLSFACRRLVHNALRRH